MKISKFIFYYFAATAILISIIGFFALADMIQWIVHFPEEFTFVVFGYRMPLMILGISTFILSLYIGFKYKLVPKFILITYTLTFILLFVGGFIAPTYIMFKSQHYDARFVSIEKALEHLSENEEALVLEINGDARAYPHIWITQPHIAGDIVGGEDVVMTYCGLSHLGIAFKNNVDGNKMDLKVMTQLRNNLVMFDAKTQEPIQQLNACYYNSGLEIDEIASTVMPLRSFKKLYPLGKVFYAPSENFIDDMTRKMMFSAIYDEGGQFDEKNPEPSFPTIEYFDKRIPSKERVFGVMIIDDKVAYTLNYLIKNNNVVVDTVGGKVVTIKYFPEYEFVDVFYGDDVNVNHYGKDENGIKLNKVAHYNQILWIIWSNFYEDTKVRV